MFKLKLNNFKKKENFFVCGKPDYHAPQYQDRKRNNNPSKTKVNMVEGADIIVVVVSQVNIVSNEKNWVVDSGATWHMCANKKLFSTYKPSNDREEVVYLRNSRIANVLRKCKVFLKLTSGKTLALNEMLYVSHIIANLVYVGLLRKFRIKVLFEFDKIVMTKNNVFVGKELTMDLLYSMLLKK